MVKMKWFFFDKCNVVGTNFVHFLITEKTDMVMLAMYTHKGRIFNTTLFERHLFQVSIHLSSKHLNHLTDVFGKYILK